MWNYECIRKQTKLYYHAANTYVYVYINENKLMYKSLNFNERLSIINGICPKGLFTQNQKFFAGEHAQFSKEAADLLLEIGVIKAIPDLSKLADTRFIK